tara:strand:- start:1506 stop:2069 length:564 start_codon:yes stop_codon:yes gene_type:complete
MYKEAAPPTASEDIANRDPYPPGARGNVGPPVTQKGESPRRGASARERFRNVPVPGGGGSMWGDEVIGRGGIHPDSDPANAHLNKQYGAPTSPIVDRTIGANWPGGDQSAQSKRLLAQDPRGKGGWAYKNTPQQRPVSQTNSNPLAIYGGSAATAPQAESTPGSRASHRPLDVYGDNWGNAISPPSR